MGTEEGGASPPRRTAKRGSDTSLLRATPLEDGLRLRPICPDDEPRIEREDGGGGQVIAVGRYEPTADAGIAEVAFVVQDGWQDKGLGRTLLRELLSAAEARGIRRFRAYVLADNSRMLRLLNRYTHILERKIDAGVVDLLFERRE